MANRMTPPTEGQEKDVLLVLDKQQGKVSAVKSLRQGRQFADRIADAWRRVHAGGQEQRCVQQLHFQFFPQVSGHFRAGTVQRKGFRSGTTGKGNRGQSPQPDTGGQQTNRNASSSEVRLSRVQAGLPLRPGKNRLGEPEKVGITADTLKNTKDFDRVMRGYKSRNIYTVSGTVGGFTSNLPMSSSLSIRQRTVR